MRKIINLNNSWSFTKQRLTIYGAIACEGEAINLPHTWNGLDGQDGGDDYIRDAFWYKKDLDIPALNDGQQVYLEFQGVNSTAKIYINDTLCYTHSGGYSTFRVNITNYLKDKNVLLVNVDNRKTEEVYPQTADFTFYGGIYRDVNLIIVDKNHFDLDYFGSIGAKIDATVSEGNGILKIEPYVVGEGKVFVTLFDKEGKEIAKSETSETITVNDVHLWNGKKDPYLYEVLIELISEGNVIDSIRKKIGFRFYNVDPNKGFFLNGVSYPLRGVCRHQDRKDIGNAITKECHDEDMELIKEIGANTIRLAHYQHDDYFLDLCDENGIVVWVEIPYISRHMDEGSDNLTSQIKELVYQQYHHPSIVVWGISNEITMFRGHTKELLKENKRLNDMVHEMDPNRLTTMACFSMCGPFNKVAKITDVVSWNLYFGWYAPLLQMNDVWFWFYHLFHKNRCVGLSEYGAEGMTNLHSNHPHRGDSTEEYQAIYHEYLLNFFSKTPYLWATHVWNMFDFGSDGRNHGGDPGVNHKGLVTFDHKTKKDSFYICKAYWSDKPFVHITGKRYVNRTGNKMVVKVYSNEPQVELFVNDKSVGKIFGKNHIFKFKVDLVDEINVKAVTRKSEDTATFKHVDKFDDNYKLHTKSNNYSWEK